MKVGVIQLNSQLDYRKNLEVITQLICKHQADYYFLPEVFYSISDGIRATPYLVEKGNEHYLNIRDIARKNHVSILGGSAASLVDNKIMNRTYNFDAKGEDLGSYDKINLFRIQKKQVTLDERELYEPGEKKYLLDLENGWRVGQTICFDLRYPRLFQEYRDLGANCFSVSSAFTPHTGRAHWEILLRARAIETQSYIIASAQTGKHNERIQTWGHSMVIDPWGEKLAEFKQEVGCAVVELDLSLVESVRASMQL